MHEPLKYPYHWGRNVINTFVESCPRGYYFLARLLDISPGEVRVMLTIALCRGSSVRFGSLKRMIKILDDYDDATFRKFSSKERKMLVTYVKQLCEDDEIDARIARDVLDTSRQKFLF